MERSSKVAKRSLSALLWPNTLDSDKAMDSLYKVISWIRKAFGGDNKVLINRTHYVCLNYEAVSSDAAEFLRLYKRGDIESLILAEKIFARTQFDCDCDYEWLAESLGFYEICYIDMLETLTSHFMNSGDARRARIYRMKSDLFFGECEF